MATWRRSSFIDILQSVGTSLQLSTGLPTACIKLANKRWWTLHYQADQLLIVIPQTISRTAGVADGSGRIMTQIERQVWVQCINRLALDTIDDGVLWFTDETYGLIPLEEAVLNALVDFRPVDSSQNALTIEPVKFLGGVPPIQDFDVAGWGQETLAFNCIYAPPVNQSYQ